MPVPKVRVADFEIPVSGNTRCYGPQFAVRTAQGRDVCRYPQFRETLPEGKSYTVLDLGYRPQDDFGPVVVPQGMLFLMGDNRDNSEDSRFEAVPGGGIGLVPQDNLVGKASVMMFSTSGDASWLKPWTWVGAARWQRIGLAL
jgi:signal peptidase I